MRYTILVVRYAIPVVQDAILVACDNLNTGSKCVVNIFTLFQESMVKLYHDEHGNKFCDL